MADNVLILAGELIARARNRTASDTITPNEHFITDAQLILELNACYRHFVEQLIGIGGAGLDKIVRVVTLQPDVPGAYPMNIDMMRIVAVDWIQGPDKLVEIPANGFSNRYVSGWRLISGSDAIFLEGRYLHEVKGPIAVWYIPSFEFVASSSTQLAFFGGFDEFAVGWLCEFIRTRNNQSTTEAVNQMARAISLLKETRSVHVMRPEALDRRK